MLHIRAGYRLGYDTGNLCLGLGFFLRKNDNNYKIDYSMRPSSHTGWVNSVSVNYGFQNLKPRTDIVSERRELRDSEMFDRCMQYAEYYLSRYDFEKTAEFLAMAAGYSEENARLTRIREKLEQKNCWFT